MRCRKRNNTAAIAGRSNHLTEFGEDRRTSGPSFCADHVAARLVAIGTSRHSPRRNILCLLDQQRPKVGTGAESLRNE